MAQMLYIICPWLTSSWSIYGRAGCASRALGGSGNFSSSLIHGCRGVMITLS